LVSVRAAPAPALIRGATAAVRNAQGLLDDAQVLAEAGCVPRAYSLGALAVEEAGKAVSLVLLTMMPQPLRALAPVGRMLEWHQLKQAQGLLIAGVSYRAPGFVPKVAVMPAEELARVLSTLDVSADEADRLKRRGLYVDVGRDGRIREPSEITETEVLSQFARAGQAASVAGQLLEPELQARLVNPPAEGVELSRAAVRALSEVGHARTPEAATNVMLNTISKLRARMTANEALTGPVSPLTS
jgi:AbiV family abortive infection protein